MPAKGIPTYKTANTLPEQIRSQSVALLNRHLAAAAVVLLASATTLANAAENPARLAREQHTCAVVLGLDPSSHRYNACLRSLDRSLSEWDYAQGVSTDRNTCERERLQPGTPAFARCVVKAVPSH
jgi:hypothetical protein